MTKNISQYARDVFNLLVGEKNAEVVKWRVGSAVEQEEISEIPLRGRDLITGLPKEVIVTDGQIREAIHKSIKAIIENIKTTLEKRHPNLLQTFMREGLFFLGRSASSWFGPVDFKRGRYSGAYCRRSDYCRRSRCRSSPRRC